MRRLFAVVVACLLVPGVAASVVSATSTTFTTNITVGASHTLPNGFYGFSDGCQTGYSGTTEYRCAFEFDMSSIPTTAKITTATLQITRTTGCATNDCPIDIASYTGNGSDDLGDVVAGSGIATWTPTNNTPHYWNVLGIIQAHATAGDDWAGFRLSRNSGSTRNPDTQDFDIAGGNRVSLAVEYVAHPIDIQVYVAGAGEGADGKVVSSPAGIDCGTTCLVTVEYASPMTLTAQPATTARFGSWSGGPCAGSTNPVCSFIVPELNVETTAQFYGKPPATQGPPGTPGPSSAPATPKPSATATAGASGAPATVGPSGEIPSVAPSGELPSVAPSDETTGTGVAPSASPLPTEPAAETGGGPPLALILVLIIGLAAALAGGWWFLGRPRQGMTPPDGTPQPDATEPPGDMPE